MDQIVSLMLWGEERMKSASIQGATMQIGYADPAPVRCS
jgi:hypothetical protein